MEKEQNTTHETVEEKMAKEEKKTDDKVENKSENKSEAVQENSSEVKADNAESRKEDLKDSDIIDIDKEQAKAEASTSNKAKTDSAKAKRGLGGKNAPKSTEDFIAKQKKRKRIRRFITLAIVLLIVLIIVLWVKNAMNKAKEALAGMQANNIQTAYVEKKTLYDSKDATGTLYALDSRTISRALKESGSGGAQIEAINVEVGDHVKAGDILVQFSSENIEESIARAKEDIGTKKKLQAINAEDAQREYVYSYSKTATDMKNSAENVEKTLKDLYEACDAYGDAKRRRDDARAKAEEDGKNWDDIKGSYEAEVAAAYQAEERAQKAYDDAVAAQADSTLASASNNLSSADSTYKKAQINSGEEVKQLTRQLNDSIESLDDYIVYATIDGVVTEVNVSEGNTFTSGNVLTIQDDSGYKVDVLIDEYDIPKIKKAYEQKKANGQELEVVVKTDATGDNEYKGHVTLIAPTSTSTTAVSATVSVSSNSVTSTASTTSTANYKVSIVIDEIDDAFMIGMSAKVAIVVNQSPDNSLCVPYNCVEETEDGKFIVKVMDEHGDKNTADDMKASFGNKGLSDTQNEDSEETESKGVNGIVVENDSDNKDSDKKSERDKKDGLLSKLSGKKGKSDEIEMGRRYREVEVEKIFDTDFYAAVVPKVEGSLKEGDEVMVVTEKASGNDIMAMFGPGGPGGF